jgi:glycosyltransferase involved in cell wall biosynthesis
MPSATVVISTKNRKEDVAKAVESAVAQTAKPEVLVIDDGSTDGTTEMLRERFPTVRLDRAEVSRGYIVQRNRGASLASGEIIFSIDDDATFPSPHTVEQTLGEFGSPRVGVVSIPYVDVRRGPRIHQRAPGDSGIFAAYTYTGTAYAARRELFLRLGGYREILVHQGEEGEFSLRLLEAGYVVCLGRADPIHHFESPRRDVRRQDYFNWRNMAVIAWLDFPASRVPIRMAAISVRLAMDIAKNGRPWNKLRGLTRGLLMGPGLLRQRQPISTETYRLHRRLFSSPATPLEEIEPLLNPMR